MTEDPFSEARVRAQRDRFLAFAFAAADVLVEVNPDHTIRFCAGASHTLFGSTNEKMLRRPVSDLIDPRDRITLAEALRRLELGAKLDHIRLRAIGSDGQEMPVLISAISLPNPGKSLHIAFSRVRLGVSDGDLDPMSPMPAETFAAMVEQRMSEGRAAGEELSLALLDLSDAAASIQDANFIAQVEGYLRACSVGGTSLGKLEDSKFGLVLDQTVDQEALEKRIVEFAHQYDPALPAVTVKASTMAMGDAEMSSEDVTKALVYTINRFVSEGGNAISLKTISDGYQAVMDETLTRVSAFRNIINSDRLMFVFQPIVDLSDWSVHHYEALARIRQGDKFYLPSSFIGFAEDVGVVSEMDMVVCQLAMKVLTENRDVPSTSRVAVNLSGRSLSNDAFLQELFSLMGRHRDLIPRLLIEITETTEIKSLEEANKVIAQLRKTGCTVCLDDFGAGAAAFHYLRALDLDLVKIDGSYIAEALDTRHGRPFLKAMALLCSELGLQAIGEMVEDEQTVRLLHDVGIGFAQGYYFARPVQSVVGLTLPDMPADWHAKVQ